MNSDQIPLSHALPKLFRVGGGPILESWLQHINIAWETAQAEVDVRDLSLLEVRTRRLGYSNVIDAIGGIARVAAPARLADLPLRQTNPQQEAEFWLDCLFGATLIRYELTRSLHEAVPANVTVTVSGARIPADVIRRILRYLLPAHSTLTVVDVSRNLTDSEP